MEERLPLGLLMVLMVSLTSMQEEMACTLAVLRSHRSRTLLVEQICKAAYHFAGDFTSNVLAVVVVLHQNLDRGVPRELSGGAHIAVGLVECCSDRRVSKPMRADHSAEPCPHCLQEPVDAISGQSPAGQHASILAEL